MKKYFIILFVLAFALNNYSVAKTNSQCENLQYSATRDDLKFYKNYAEQAKKERMTIFNALLLTDEQLDCQNKLFNEYSELLKNKYKELSEQTKVFNELKNKNASRKSLAIQERRVNSIKKEIKKIIENENKQIVKILDREQKSKFKMIQKLQKKSVKDLKKEKNYYKSNPKMRPFACPKKN